MRKEFEGSYYEKDSKDQS